MLLATEIKQNNLNHKETKSYKTIPTLNNKYPRISRYVPIIAAKFRMKYQMEYYSNSGDKS
jgi:hypothetical protein